MNSVNIQNIIAFKSFLSQKESSEPVVLTVLKHNAARSTILSDMDTAGRFWRCTL